MEELERGTVLKGMCKVQNLISDNEFWQLYVTNLGTYAVIADKALIENQIKFIYDKEFIASGKSLKDIFYYDESFDKYIYISKRGKLASSIKDGPFPNNINQVRIFFKAYKNFANDDYDYYLDDGLYIEEFETILFVFESNPSKKGFSIDENVIGRWIAGGIKVNVCSVETIEEIVKWLPKGEISKLINEVGFSTDMLFVGDYDDDNEEDVLDRKIGGEEEHKERKPMPKEPFNLIGRPNLTKFFNENIINILKNEEEYKRVGINFPGGVILYGAPGCGKTYAVERLTEYIGWPVYSINSSSIGSKYIHETAKLIGDTFNKAIKNAPSIVVIDELEAFTSKREADSHDHHIEEVDEFLRMVPKAIENHVLVLAMTNMLEAVDEALTRRGRFDYLIEVPPASIEEIESLLLSKFEDLPIEESVNAYDIAKYLQGRPLSDVTFVLREAGKFSVMEKKEKIDNDCFTKALDMLPKSSKPRSMGFK